MKGRKGRRYSLAYSDLEWRVLTIHCNSHYNNSSIQLMTENQSLLGLACNEALICFTSLSIWIVDFYFHFLKKRKSVSSPWKAIETLACENKSYFKEVVLFFSVLVGFSYWVSASPKEPACIRRQRIPQHYSQMCLALVSGCCYHHKGRG